MEHNANANAIDKFGQIPLHYAARYGSSQIAKLFVEQGINVDTKSYSDQTPLFHCISVLGLRFVDNFVNSDGFDCLPDPLIRVSLETVKDILLQGSAKLPKLSAYPLPATAYSIIVAPKQMGRPNKDTRAQFEKSLKKTQKKKTVEPPSAPLPLQPISFGFAPSNTLATKTAEFGTTSTFATPSIFGTNTSFATPSFGTSTSFATPSFGTSTSFATPSFGTTVTNTSIFGTNTPTIPSTSFGKPSPSTSVATSSFATPFTSITTFGKTTSSYGNTLSSKGFQSQIQPASPISTPPKASIQYADTSLSLSAFGPQPGSILGISDPNLSFGVVPHSSQSLADFGPQPGMSYVEEITAGNANYAPSAGFAISDNRQHSVDLDSTFTRSSDESSSLSKMLLLISKIFKEGYISHNEKRIIKKGALEHNKLIESALECYEVDFDISECSDTLKKIIKL